MAAYAIVGACVLATGIILFRAIPGEQEDFYRPLEGSGDYYSSSSSSAGAPRPATAFTIPEIDYRPMTPADRQIAQTGVDEFRRGKALFDAAGLPGAEREQSKLEEARVHLRSAQERFEQIQGTPDVGLEAVIQECNRLLFQCGRRTILHVGG